MGRGARPLVIGGLLGVVGGFVGGRTNTVIMRTMDVFYAFPSVLLAVAIAGAMGGGIVNGMLAQLGFEVEGFGGHTLLVHSVPMPHPRFDAERCLRETLAALAGDRDATSHARHERLAATVACKAAIKAGDELSSGEMRALFIALGATRLPAHDVHGRSTIVQLSWPELERRFGRQ